MQAVIEEFLCTFDAVVVNTEQSRRRCTVHVGRVTTVQCSGTWSVYEATASVNLDITLSPLSAVSSPASNVTVSIIITAIITSPQ